MSWVLLTLKKIAVKPRSVEEIKTKIPKGFDITKTRINTKNKTIKLIFV